MEVTNWVLAPDSCPDNKMTSRLQLVRIILMCHFRLRVIIVLRKQHAERLCSLSYYVFFLLPVQTILVTQIIRMWPSDLAKWPLCYAGACGPYDFILISCKILLVKVIFLFIQSWNILFLLWTTNSFLNAIIFPLNVMTMCINEHQKWFCQFK